MKHKVTVVFKTAGKIILLLICLAAALLPALVMKSVYGWLLFLFICLFLAMSIAAMFIIRSRFSVEAATGTQVVRRRGEAAEADLRLINRSVISCPKAEADVVISDAFGAYNASRKSRFSVPGKDHVSFGFDADMSHIGIYSVGIEKVTIYDLTGIFHVTVPVSGKISACIMPRISHVDELHVDEDITAQSSNNTRVIIAGGTDYSGVREYALGDPMKQIHWKLSAHSNEYMTKLQENNRQQEYAVILDFASIQYPDHEWLLDVNDALIETALSLVTDVSARDCGFRLIYPDRNRNIRRISPSGRSDDLEMISSFLPICDDPDRSFPDACTMLQEEAKGHNRCTNILVVTSRPGSDLVQELINARNQRRSPELYLIVPCGFDSRRIEELTAPLKALNDHEIPYFVITTDVNRQVHGEEAAV